MNRSVSANTRSFVARRHKRRAERRREQIVSLFRRRWVKIARVVVEEFRLWITIVAIVSVVVGSSVVLFSPFLSVRKITIRRTDARVDIAEAQQALTSLFHRRLFLVTSAQIEALLKPQFPDITSVSVNKDYPSTLFVSVHLDPLVASLTIESPENPPTGSGANRDTAASGAYLTSNGYIVYTPSKIDVAGLANFIVRDWGARPENRTLLFDPSFIKQIFEARATLEEAFNLHVTAIAIYVRAQEFHLQTHNRWFWFDVASPLTQQVERLRQFLKRVPLANVQEYIDLRLSDRIVYR
jgi:hypothetical protein